MGETVKLVNQIIIANVMIANVEGAGLRATRRAPISTRVREVLATATASNYLLDQWLPKTWLAGTFEGGFALDLLRKDLAAALDAARAHELSDAGDGTCVSTLHCSIGRRGRRAGLQRDRQIV